MVKSERERSTKRWRALSKLERPGLFYCVPVSIRTETSVHLFFPFPSFSTSLFSSKAFFARHPPSLSLPPSLVHSVLPRAFNGSSPWPRSFVCSGCRATPSGKISSQVSSDTRGVTYRRGPSAGIVASLELAPGWYTCPLAPIRRRYSSLSRELYRDVLYEGGREREGKFRKMVFGVTIRGTVLAWFSA